jgi:hypothetical protein
MEKYKTGVSDLDLLKHQITNSDPSEVDTIIENRPQESVENLNKEENKMETKEVEHTLVNNPTSIPTSIPMAEEEESPFVINNVLGQSAVIIDNFYKNPDKVRKFALEQEFIVNNDFYRGKRTKSFKMPHQKNVLSLIMGAKLKNWEEYAVSGCFQIQEAEDAEVIHIDQQEYAAIVYLTPNAPANCGSSLYRSRLTGIRSKHDLVNKSEEEANDIFNRTFEYGFFDKSKFDEIDRIGNVYNRLAIFNVKNIHACTRTFGNSNDNARLFQLFFFDLEDPK